MSMDRVANPFKRAILAGQQQVGLWNTIRDPYIGEMLAGTGYDWILIDCEHTPRDLDNVLQMMQAMGRSNTAPVVRVTHMDAAEIKRVLDIGAQNILVPYVRDVAEAEAAAQSVAYPPRGIRGMGGATRANLFGEVDGYFAKARDEICLMVQVETKEALDDLEAIAAVDGIDAIFIGPADLAASMGYPGQLDHPVVVEAVTSGLKRIRAAGKPAGFLSVDQTMLDLAVAAGSVFTAVDIDSLLLKKAVTSRLSDVQKWKKG
ncbi:HpcH/HpaI aldolase family protein [Celeribacter marinus]|uniref:Hydroxypyruvate/pyruvate aldolase n=1 Tax=Celeribacter marinus TaxID=1397108 RepID=A0A0P0ABN8_9RHOB|nr:HpcH/HpaI aldolase/citrate lyase family protein [Celeribacter marinus]ALI56175.1 2,4-dihydroxyhept-2-ene-1,7-dioic acid aldolase [Celeribacter marinus]SFK85843.1 2,4-dihydroxyhept-2-enedioate aldolase [Celeribacter marinus]